MNNFMKEQRGNVTHYLIVIAVVLIILLLALLPIARKMKCATNDTIGRIARVVLNITPSEQAAQCVGGALSGGGTGTTPSPSASPDSGGAATPTPTGGGEVATVEIPMPSSSPTVAGPPSNGGGSNGSGGGAPISYTDYTNLNLTCYPTYSYYKFSIPSAATPQSTGTQTLTVRNQKGWDNWIKIDKIDTANGLQINSYDKGYELFLAAGTASFKVNWLWNEPYAYNGPLGEATVYFQTVCTQPPAGYSSAPAAPTNFRASNIMLTSAKLLWDRSADAESYRLYRDSALIYEGSALSYNDSSLSPGAAYDYKLVAVNPAGNSLPAATSIFTHFNVKSFRVISKNESSITVGWDTLNNATSYILETQGKGVIYTGSNTSHTITGLSPNSAYTFYASAKIGSNFSYQTSLTASTTADPLAPAPPASFRIVNITDTLVTLAWDQVSNANLYNLAVDGKSVYAGTDLTYAAGALLPGTTYTFTLRATNGFGDSPAMNASGTTLGVSPKPSAIKNFRTTNIANNSISLAWDASPNADWYMMSLDGSTPFRVDGQMYTSQNLKPGILYMFRLYAVNTFGNSPTADQYVTTTTSTYDGSTSVGSGCQVNEFTKPYDIPSDAQPGTSGKFSINLTNQSAQDVFAAIVSIDKNGALFAGASPVALTYEVTDKMISPSSTLSLPVNWSYPPDPQGRYKGAAGSIVVHLKTHC